MAAQHEERFDSLAAADELQLLDPPFAVRTRKVLGRDPRRFGHPWVAHELSSRRRPCRIEVRYGLCRRFDGGLTGTLSPSIHNEALLSGT
jgi:hypothetical protein